MTSAVLAVANTVCRNSSMSVRPMPHKYELYLFTVQGVLCHSAQPRTRQRLERERANIIGRYFASSGKIRRRSSRAPHRHRRVSSGKPINLDISVFILIWNLNSAAAGRFRTRTSRCSVSGHSTCKRFASLSSKRTKSSNATSTLCPKHWQKHTLPCCPGKRSSGPPLK